MKKITKYISLFLVILFFSFCFAESAMAEGYSWYCKRNREHKQPICDPNMSFIEKYGGVYVDKEHGDNAEEKVVYLTFDAGYENGNIARILDTLQSENVRASFFILENLITRNTDLVKRMAEEGHTVCNHTMRHKNITTVSSVDELEKELSGLENIYREYTGYEMAKYFRPPEGRFDEKSLKFADDLGYKTVFWSLAYADWDNNNQPSRDTAMKKLLDNMHNGAIILLHPTSSTNAEILPEFIKTLKGQGYSFRTLDALFAKELNDE